ncbi:hypothetical protein D9M72_351990 [compost metagenome]
MLCGLGARGLLAQLRDQLHVLELQRNRVPRHARVVAGKDQQHAQVQRRAEKHRQVLDIAGGKECDPDRNDRRQEETDCHRQAGREHGQRRRAHAGDQRQHADHHRRLAHVQVQPCHQAPQRADQRQHRGHAARVAPRAGFGEPSRQPQPAEIRNRTGQGHRARPGQGAGPVAGQGQARRQDKGRQRAAQHGTAEALVDQGHLRGQQPRLVVAGQPRQPHA